MMSDANFSQLVKQLVDDSLMIQQVAEMILLALDEDAVDPLIDEFYAGVTDAQGVAILEIMAKIGGPDAMSTLRNVFHFEESRASLKYAAANGLLFNSDNLSQDELEEIALFIASSSHGT